jgi:hypothetical protein
VHVEVNRWPRKKSIKTINAEDNTADILAEAEYIFNNADEFLAGVEEEYLLAA